MVDPEFDPYSQWLQIGPGHRPPDLYTLLGVPAFTADESTIEAAYHQRYALVRRYQVGKRSAEALRLLAELSDAYQRLTNEVARQRYDADLRSQSQSAVTPAPIPLEAVAEEAEFVPTSWFYTVRGAIVGPVTWEDVEHAMWSHLLDASSEVWQQGWPQRRLATDLFPDINLATHLQPLPQQLPTQTQSPQRAANAVTSEPRFKAYQPSDPDQRSSSGRTAIVATLFAIGMALQMVSVWYEVHGDLFWWISSFMSVIGLVVFSIGLLEPRALFNSIVGGLVRSQIGDRATRTSLVTSGGILLFLGYAMVGGEAARHIWHITWDPDPEGTARRARTTFPFAPASPSAQHTRTTEELLADLRADDVGTVRAALAYLNQLPTPQRNEEVVRQLFSMLHGHSAQQASAALVDRVSAKDLPQLTISLRDSSIDYSARTMLALALRKLDTSQATALLVSLLGEQDLQSVARLELIKTGPDAEPFLLAELRRTDSQLQLQACGLLADVGTDACMPVLRDIAANSPDAQLRATAATSIAAINAR